VPHTVGWKRKSFVLLPHGASEGGDVEERFGATPGGLGENAGVRNPDRFHRFDACEVRDRERGGRDDEYRGGEECTDNEANVAVIAAAGGVSSEPQPGCGLPGAESAYDAALSALPSLLRAASARTRAYATPTASTVSMLVRYVIVKGAAETTSTVAAKKILITRPTSQLLHGSASDYAVIAAAGGVSSEPQPGCGLPGAESAYDAALSALPSLLRALREIVGRRLLLSLEKVSRLPWWAEEDAAYI
jgi:hypothetical protein